MLARPPLFNRHVPGFELYLRLRFNPLNVQVQSGLEASLIQSTARKKMITIPALVNELLPVQHKKEIG